jgi:PD-(D/E)XK endonuclease
MENEKTLVKTVLTGNLSRREAARKRRTEHEIAYKSVQNPCSPFFGRSADLASEIRCRSSVVEHLIGNEEVDGSIPSGSTIPTKTTERGSLSEMEVTLRLARMGASVWTPAFGHDHPFDLIAHWAGFLSRIQVKTMRDVDDGSIALNGARVVDRTGGKRFPAITAADCDVIIGFHPAGATAYVVRPVGKTLYTLRRTPAKNGQIVGIMYEQDFRLTSLEQIKPISK